MKSKLESAAVCGAAVLIGGALIGIFAAYPPLTPGDWAAWAQAFGSIAAVGLGLWVVQRQRTLEMRRHAELAAAARLSLHQGALQLVGAVYQVSEKVKSHPDETALDLLHLSLELEGVTAALASVDPLRFDMPRAIDALLVAQAASRKLLSHLQRAYDLSLDGRGHKWAPVKEFAEQASEAVKPPMEALRAALGEMQEAPTPN
ncbi:hypothetical protein VLK31_02555 [Variovorax sp. H27-G14]|uniref:hypothetical protein n=1 Tax=Variovorax sp. H27-G14 TaxID=3111914 RepID=UPI0038FCB766